MEWGQLVRLRSFSKNHIDIEIQENKENTRCKFTGFYEAFDVRDKVETWNLLRTLRRSRDLP